MGGTRANMIKARGLVTYGSEISVAEGSQRQATNVNIDEEGVISPRRGFNDYAGPTTGSSDSLAIVSQIMEYKDSILRQYQDKVEYEDSNGDFQAINGSYAKLRNGYRTKYQESNSNLYFTSDVGIQKISVKDRASLNADMITAAGGIKAGYSSGKVVPTVGGFLPPESKVAYRVMFGTKDANNNLIYGSPSSRFVVSNYNTSTITPESCSIDILLYGTIANGDYFTYSNSTGKYTIYFDIDTNSVEPKTSRTIGSTYIKVPIQAIGTNKAVAAVLANEMSAIPNSNISIDTTIDTKVIIETSEEGDIAGITDAKDKDDTGSIPLVILTATDAEGNVQEGSSTTVEVTGVVPNNTTTDYFYQVYRSSTISVSTGLTVNDLDPGDELNLVYEAGLTDEEVTAGEFTFTDTTPESFRAEAAPLHTNNATGEGILQANEVPPIALDIELFRGYMFYANTKEKHRTEFTIVSVDDFVSGSTKIVIGNSDITRYYTFIGTTQVQDITIDTIPLNGTYFNLYSANDERRYYVYFGGIDPEVAGAIGYRIDITGSPSTSDIADRIEAALVDNIDVTLSVLSNVVTFTHTNNGYTTGITNGIGANITIDTPSTLGTGELSGTDEGGDVLLSGLISVGQSIDETARSLVKIISKDPDSPVNAYYLSSSEDLPGNILLEARSLEDKYFYLSVESGTPAYSAVTEYKVNDEVEIDIDQGGAPSKGFIADGDYVSINSNVNNYTFWFNVSGGASDPLIPGTIGIEVDISALPTSDGLVRVLLGDAMEAISNFEYHITTIGTIKLHSKTIEDMPDSTITIADVLLPVTITNTDNEVDATDRVLFNENIYVCAQNTLGNDPSGTTANNAYWTYVDIGAEFTPELPISRNIEEYTGATTVTNIKLTSHDYITGDEVFVGVFEVPYDNAVAYLAATPDVVEYSGNLYECILDSTGNLPSGDTTDNTYWKYISEQFSGVYPVTYIDDDNFSIVVATPAATVSFVPTFSTVFSPDVESDNKELPNRIYYSKKNEPEAVPIVNYIDVGTQDGEIKRILALRDNLFVLKDDGIYVVSGTSAPDWSVRLIDSTKILAADSAVVLNNQIYCLTEQGITRINGSGAAIISRGIEDQIDLITNQQFDYASNTFGIAYENDRAYIMFAPKDSTDTSATQAFRYNIFEQTWSKWEYEATCGHVLARNNKLYLGEADRNVISQERKNNDRTDHADRNFSAAINTDGVEANVVELSSLVGVEVNDVIVQEQEVTINYINNRLLRKMDYFDTNLSLGSSGGIVTYPDTSTVNFYTPYPHQLENGSTWSIRIVSSEPTTTIEDYVVTKIDANNFTIPYDSSSFSIDEAIFKEYYYRTFIASNGDNIPAIMEALNDHLFLLDFYSAPSYVGTTIYNPGDIVKFNSLKYECILVTTGIDDTSEDPSGAATDNTYWSYITTVPVISNKTYTYINVRANTELLVDELNTTLAITSIKSYKKPTTVFYEAYIESIDKLRNQVTMHIERPFIEGAIEVYKGFTCTIEWNPQHFGDPSALKQINYVTIMFDQNNFYNATASFASDVSQALNTVNFKGKGIGYWGDMPWSDPNHYWGGVGNDVPFRNPVPRSKQKCRYLSITFEHKNAREDFRIVGISGVVRAISDRAYR